VALRAPSPIEAEPLPALVQRVRDDVERIVRAEILLVQVRTRAAAAACRAAGAGLAAAAALGVVGIGIVLAGVVIVLATVIPSWLAAFAVGGGTLVIAAVVAFVELRVLTHGVSDALAPIDAPLHGRRRDGE
jgi:hypothetical protein